jgi:hypothetical protein
MMMYLENRASKISCVFVRRKADDNEAKVKGEVQKARKARRGTVDEES